MHTLTIPPSHAVSLYKISAQRAIIIQSKRRILQSEIGKIQKIVNSWLKVVQLEEVLRDPGHHFGKFQKYLAARAPLEQWKQEPEYPEFLATIKQLVEADTTYEQIKREYKIISVEFLNAQTSPCPPKNTQEKAAV